MTDCCSIATFDTDVSNGSQRTLYHAAGSNPPAAYFTELVRLIPEEHDVFVIIDNGSDDIHRDTFESMHVGNVKEQLTAAMKKAKKSMDEVVFRTFFTLPDDGTAKMMQKGSFVLMSRAFGEELR
jgi:radical SAM superfamily enzyme